jgi:hypothetical protein
MARPPIQRRLDARKISPTGLSFDQKKVKAKKSAAENGCPAGNAALFLPEIFFAFFLPFDSCDRRATDSRAYCSRNSRTALAQPMEYFYN